MGKWISISRRILPFLVIACIWLYSTALHFLWLLLDKAPPEGDGIPFVLRGMELYAKIEQSGTFSGIKFLLFSADHPQYAYPPVVSLFYFLYYQLFGLESRMEMMISAVFLLFAMIGIYKTGERMFDKVSGLIAVLIFASSPGVLFYSKLGFKEFYLMCCLPLSLYFLLATSGFKNRKSSLLFGLLSGLCMAIKWEFLVFVITPLGILLFYYLKTGRSGERVVRAKNLCLASVLALSIFVPWYVLNPQIRNVLWSRFGRTNPSYDAIHFCVRDLGHYLYSLTKIMTGFHLILLAIALVFIFCRVFFPRKITIREKRQLFLCIAFLFPLAVFSLISSKSCDHILPLLVFSSLIIAGCFMGMGSIVIKTVMVFLLVSHFANVYFFNVIRNNLPIRGKQPFSMKLNVIDSFFKNSYRFFGIRGPIRKYDWNNAIKDMLLFVKYDSLQENGNPETPRVLLLSNHYPFRMHQLEYENLKLNKPVSIYSYIFNYSSSLRNDIFEDNYDYLIIEYPVIFYPQAENNRLPELIKFIEKNVDEFSKAYDIAGIIELPRRLEDENVRVTYMPGLEEGLSSRMNDSGDLLIKEGVEEENTKPSLSFSRLLGLNNQKSVAVIYRNNKIKD